MAPRGHGASLWGDWGDQRGHEASSARSHGAEIRVSAGVESVIVKGGKAVGVAMEGSGDTIHAKTVVSGCERA